MLQTEGHCLFSFQAAVEEPGMTSSHTVIPLDDRDQSSPAGYGHQLISTPSPEEGDTVSGELADFISKLQDPDVVRRFYQEYKQLVKSPLGAKEILFGYLKMVLDVGLFH